MVAITGVLFLSETWAKNLKMSPSLAIEKTTRGVAIAAPSALQRHHSSHNYSTIVNATFCGTEF